MAVERPSNCNHRITVVYNALVSIDVQSCSSMHPVSNGMGDSLRLGKPSRRATSHPGQLSLAIRSWVGAMSTGDGYINCKFCESVGPGTRTTGILTQSFKGTGC